jgi:NADH-quinone oxidoreductase subunit F
MSLTPVLTKRFGTNAPWLLDNYEKLDGYVAMRKAFAMAPDDVIALVRESNLRGRGGAGFPTGMKWSFVKEAPGHQPGPRYVVVNADEGEPGTCRDLPLMMNDPHSLIEGTIIACHAIRAQHAFIYIRGESVHAIRRVTQAVNEAYAKGYLGADVLGSGLRYDITVHAGAGAYICGEETALLDSLEGRRGQPRLKPPFPATNGLYNLPTTVNNVGTLATVPYIVLGGAAWHKEQVAEDKKTWTANFNAGKPDAAKLDAYGSPGTSIYSLSGRVRNPGQYEAPMGTTLRELLELAGGMSRGKELKFWTPGGSSTPMFTAEHLDIPLDFDAVARAGSMNGTSAVMVFDTDDNVVRAVLKWTQFYEHESCGKCTPCREGNFWTAQILERFVHGEGTEADIDKLLDICDNILGRSFCALGDGAVSPIASSIQYFRDDYLALVNKELNSSPTALTGASA